MRSVPNLLADVRKGNSGSTVVEFALILPAFILLIVGGFYLALLLFTSSGMQYATEAGARCASINTAVCSSTTATAAYAQSLFRGSAGSTPVFTAGTAACGHVVSATMTYSLNTGLTKFNVPLSSTSCYP